MLLWKKRRKRRRRGQRHLSAIMLESAFTCCGRLFSTCRHTKMGLHISQSWSQVEMGGKNEPGTEFKAGVYGGMKHQECTQVKWMYFLNRDAEQLGFLFVFLSFFWMILRDRERTGVFQCRKLREFLPPRRLLGDGASAWGSAPRIALLPGWDHWSVLPAEGGGSRFGVCSRMTRIRAKSRIFAGCWGRQLC